MARRKTDADQAGGYRVRLLDLADAAGMPAEHVHQFLADGELAGDWAEELSVTPATAARVITSVRAGARRGQYEQQHREIVAERASKRESFAQAAGATAAQRVDRQYTASQAGGDTSGLIAAIRAPAEFRTPAWTNAYAAALKQFDKDEPEMSVEAWVSQQEKTAAGA